MEPEQIATNTQTQSREGRLHEITDMLDRISVDTWQFVTSYVLMDSQDAVSQRRNTGRIDLVTELESVQKLT